MAWKLKEQLLHYEEWCREQLETATKGMVIAETHPAVAAYNGNIYRLSDGRMVEWLGSDWYLVERDPRFPDSIRGGVDYRPFRHTPLCPYESRFDGVGRTLIIEGEEFGPDQYERSGREARWCWYIPSRPGEPGHRYAARSERYYLEADLRRASLGLEYARHLLEQLDDIMAWCQRRAAQQGELRARHRWCQNGDVPELQALFAPGFDLDSLPDHGPLSCAIHSEIDVLALGRALSYGC